MISTRRYLLYLGLMVIMMYMMYDGFKEEMDALSEITNKKNFNLEIKPKQQRELSAWDNQKTIQWYDTYHNNTGLRQRSLGVDFEKCSNKNCKLLKYYEYNPHDIGLQHGPLDADAVIFQGSHLKYLSPPRRRDSDQVFVFAEREPLWNLGLYHSMLSPAKQCKTLKDEEVHWFSKIIPNAVINPQHYINTLKFRDVFNWTMTYRRDSDIPMYYGNIIHKKDATDKDKFMLERVNKRKHYDNIFNKKVYDVVWLVSHCSTQSKREKYVDKLRKYINVDVIGKCGEDLCPKQKKRSGCMEDIERKYKFVLSFENTFHKDYVTEKLFDWFSKDIVPVVYGMADYEKIVPAGTVINADDYFSPKLLAEYLKYVGSNRDTYVQFLRRKRRYVTVSHDVMQQTSYCRLCDWLHHLDANRKSYPKIDKWWQLNDTSEFMKLYSQAMPKDEKRQLSIWCLLLIFIVLLAVCYQYGLLAYKTVMKSQKEKVIYNFIPHNISNS